MTLADAISTIEVMSQTSDLYDCELYLARNTITGDYSILIDRADVLVEVGDRIAGMYYDGYWTSYRHEVREFLVSKRKNVY